MGIPLDIRALNADAWNLSCPDWQDRIRRGLSLVPGLPLFKGEADIAVQFFDGLKLPDVAGTPPLREAAGDWFRDIVRALFGSRNPKTNKRMIREVFALVPKGSSKTSYGSALMMTALLMNKTPKAVFLLIAPHQSTADLAFSQAAGMVQLDKELSKRFHVKEHVKEIVDRLNGSTLAIKTFGLEALTGPKPNGVLLDELHLLGRNAHTAKVLRQVRGGLEKRTDGFLLITTTQSDEPPMGAFKDELEIARAIRDGKRPGRMLPILYEFPDDIANDNEQWEDPANWPMVMPNLGRSIHLDSLYDDWSTERDKGQAAIAVWASQHLNIEIGKGMKRDGWPGAKHWTKRADDTITLDSLIERSEVIAIGVDGGGLDDIFGLAVLGRERITKRWLLWTRGWAHKDVLKLRKTIAGQLERAAARDELVIVDDELKDISEIVGIVQTVLDSGLLATVAVDPAGLGELVDELAVIEVTVENGLLEGVRQGFALMNAIKTTERKLASGKFIHSGSELAGWCVDNLKIEPTATAIRATKQNAGDAKIDVAMAMFNAVAIMSDNPEPKVVRSVYEERGIRFA